MMTRSRPSRVNIAANCALTGSTGLPVDEMPPPAPLPPGLLMRPRNRVASDDLACRRLVKIQPALTLGEAAPITPVFTVAPAGPHGSGVSSNQQSDEHLRLDGGNGGAGHSLVTNRR